MRSQEREQIFFFTRQDICQVLFIEHRNSHLINSKLQESRHVKDCLCRLFFLMIMEFEAFELSNSYDVHTRSILFFISYFRKIEMTCLSIIRSVNSKIWQFAALINRKTSQNRFHPGEHSLSRSGVLHFITYFIFKEEVLAE